MNTRANSFLCAGFFLLVTGNGAYIKQTFGDSIEYLGLILLIMCELQSTKRNPRNIKYIFSGAIPLMLMVIGPLMLISVLKTKVSVFIASAVLVFLTIYSTDILTTDYKILLAARSIVFACVITVTIGLVTNTLGIYTSNKGIGFICYCGFLVKNYCGGIWFTAFILYYIFFLKTGKLRKRKNHLKLFILMLLIVISGSKGAIILTVIFWGTVNFQKYFKIRADQRKVAIILLSALFIVIGAVLFNKVFSNIHTYAYRIRGVEAVIDKFISDPKKYFFGLSNIAYGNSTNNYTVNMRTYFGWQASVEIAYVNIFIKYGIPGFLAFLIIYRHFFTSLKKLTRLDKILVLSLLCTILISGFVETYMVTVHYVVGPVIYCLMNGIINQSDTH